MIALVAVLGCDGDHDDKGHPPVDDGPPTLIASSSEATEVAYSDLAFAPDGTLWVSWAEIHEGDVVDVRVVHSEDGGRTFSEPILADDVDEIFLGGAREPVLAVDGERVAIAVGGGSYASENSILLLVAPTGDPVFETRVLDEAFYDPTAEDGTITLVDQPEVFFDRDGLLWLNWKRGTINESFQLMQAREAEGFTIVPLDDGVRGEPCECCPTDYLQYPDGDVVLAFRNNDLNLREIWLGSAPGGGDFTEAFQVSTTGLVWPGCPFDGPVLASVGEALVATWADASAGDNYQWMAVSHDRGRIWTPSFRVEPDNGESMTWPQVVTAADGTLWSSAYEIFHQTNVFTTTDLGATFTSHPADAPTGPLFASEIAASPSGDVGVVGITEAGELWYVRVSDGA